MKRIISAAVIFLLIGGISSAALSTNQQATFTVSVASVFELSIDQGFIDFGRMNPGDMKWNMPPAGITVQSKSNSGKPWYLKVSNDSPFSSGSNTIPNSNFSWSGWTDGSGKWYGDGTNQVSVTPTLVYSSGAGEENNLPNGTVNHMKFKLKVPNNQVPGNYTTIVKFTMTE